MTPKEFSELSEGDRVRRVSGPGNLATAFAVVANYGSSVTIANVRHVSNPPEWLLDGLELCTLAQLKVGAQLQHKAHDTPFIVTSVHDDCALVVQTTLLTVEEAANWKPVFKASFTEVHGN